MGKISIDRNGVDLVMVEGNWGKDRVYLRREFPALLEHGVYTWE